MDNIKQVAIATLTYLVLIGSPAWAETIEPRTISAPTQLRPGEGALLLSIRHQTPLSETMHVRFVSTVDPSRILKFERKVGLGGLSRMLARHVTIYAVPAGGWKLVSHVAGCDQTIKPGDMCRLSIGGHSFPLPSAVYPADWFMIDVPANGFTDANELSLEFPADTQLGVPTTASVEDRIRSLLFPARQIPASDKAIARPFLTLPGGRTTVAAAAMSAIDCERPAKALKLSYNPFHCE